VFWWILHLASFLLLPWFCGWQMRLLVLEGENECAASKGSPCHREENRTEMKTWKKNKIFLLAVKIILSG